MRSAEDWIATLGLMPHPEGGFYRETFRSPTSSAIYFLLRKADVSAFHRIASDELWHLYAVTPFTRLRIWRLGAGPLASFVLGTEPERGEVFQDFVPAGEWFAGEIEVLEGGAPETAYALVGCTVSPGFEFDQFELADGDELARRWPDHAALANRLSLKQVRSVAGRHRGPL